MIGPALVRRMTDKSDAWRICSKIPQEQLTSEHGLQVIFGLLDQRYIKPPVERMFALFQKLMFGIVKL